MLSAVRVTLGFLTTPERIRYYGLISARALSGLLDLFGIALIAFLAATASTQLTPGKPTALPTIMGIQLPVIQPDQLLWLVVFVLVVFAVKAVLAVFLMRAQAHLVATVETRNASRITDFLLSGTLASTKRYSKADVQFAVTGSTTYAFTGLLNNVANLVTESFLLLVISAAFFFVNPITTLFTLVYFAIVVLVIQLFIGRSLKRAGRDANAGTIETIGSLNDTLDTFREISVLHKQQHFIDQITRSRARIARSNATMTFLGGMPRYVIESALILGVVILVAQQFLTGELSTGLVTVGVFLAGGVRMMASLLPLQSAVSNMRQNSEQAQPSLELLRQVAELDRVAARATGATTVPPIPGGESGLALAMDGVTFRYHDGDSDTIHGVSLDVEPGHYVAIIGPSGAGKTTIVDLILGLIEPGEGTVRIGGIDPQVLREKSPGLIAYVPQKPGLISGTIAQNIALGVDEADIDHAILADVVEAAHLREFIDSLPHGLDTSVGKQVDSLSGGQIQRVGVARALYSRPRFLVLDEATSGLDASSEAFISATLRNLHGRVTVVVIAHRLSTVQHADRVFVVDDGRVTASGDFKTVSREVPMVAEYVKLMSFDGPDAPQDTPPAEA